jgi:hypothetical protein
VTWFRALAWVKSATGIGWSPCLLVGSADFDVEAEV